jgi:tetratricopeptide (TPR) repeat protein
MLAGPAAEGVLAFEQPGGGSDGVRASQFAGVLRDAGVPVVVLNACQSGAVGKDLEASVATALLRNGCAAVVAMAYSVYAVAAAEFMAVFYERLFAGDTLSGAVTAGRRRLFDHNGRPSLKGELPLADWLVPVHYLRRDVAFPQAHTPRPTTVPSLDALLDEQRMPAGAGAGGAGELNPAGDVFVGRDDLLYQLESAARLQHVVVLTGPGGTGKTELAKGFARWWRDTGGVDDPRLVCWHSFEPGVASFGLVGVVSSIGLGVFGADFTRLEPGERLAAVKELLARYRALLVWDNFETVREMPDPTGATPPLDDPGRGQLAQFLAWVRDHSRSAVIITSRTQEGWLGQVRRIEVGGLNRQEAAEYAGHLLAPYPAARERQQHRSFGELLEWLDGHPLGMRLTLPRLDSTGPAALLAGLRGTTALLAEDTAEGRLSSLGACLTYSFTHLAEETRRRLPAVSLFHGVADEDVLMAFSAVEGVPGRFAGASKQQWTAVLEDATRVGVLTSLGGGMYQIHPALPGYLTAGWQAENPAGYSGERAACELALCTACAVFSRWLIGQIGSGDAALAYVIIGLQRRTLGAMLGHALDHHAWADADLIVRALDMYWDSRGLGQEAAAWTDRILHATTRSSQDTLAAETPAGSLWLYATVQQANRQRDAGQLNQAGQTYRKALAYLQDQPASDWTRTNIAVLYHQLGRTAQDRGRLDEADDWYRKSLTIKEERGDRPGMANTYHQLGMTAEARGRLDEADDWYRKSLTIEEERGNRPGMAVSYHQLGITAHGRGRLDEAEDWYRKALTLNEELGNRPHMAPTYHALGMTAEARGRLDEADDWYRKALTLNEELGNQPGMARIYHQLGATAQNRGRLDEAEDWYRKALTLNEELGNQPGMASTYHQFGTTAEARGRLDEADDWYRKALTIFEELGDRPKMAMTYGQFGLLAEVRQQPGQALDWIVRCVTLFDQFPHPMTGPGPDHLARLTRQLGIPALDHTWQHVTGQPLPQAVRDYLTSRPDQDPPGGQP